MSKYDIIVIGGGHNGLTAAALLAKKGRKVLLLENRNILGGIAAGEEFHPGFTTHGLIHDTSKLRPSVISELELKKHGLELIPNYEVAILNADGTGITISRDDAVTAKSIASFSENDATAYLEYREFIDTIKGFVQGLFNDTPPDFSSLNRKTLFSMAVKGFALKRLGNKIMLEFLRVAPMCTADFLNERFETDFLKAGLCAPAHYGSYTGPWSAGTCLNMLLNGCLSYAQVKGGPAAVINALSRAAQANGVEMRTDAEVAQIIMCDGRATGIRTTNGEEIEANYIAASCTPQTTFLNLIDPNEIEYGLEKSISNIRSRGTTAKVHLALSEPLKFKYESSGEISFARTAKSIDDTEKAFDCVKYAEFSKEPILDIYSSSDNLKVVSLLVHFVPHNLKGGWNDDKKNELADVVVNSLEQYTDGLKESIQNVEVLTPVDLEERYGLYRGNIFHGEHAIDQLITRPSIELMTYSTPIEGLFLCGGGSHPGGGITGMPGLLGAKAILSK